MKRNRILFLGTVALFLIAATQFVGCRAGFIGGNSNDDDSGYKYTVTFKNQSSYTIQVNISSPSDVSPSSFSLSSGASKTIGTNSSYIDWDYSRSDGTKTGVTHTEGTGTITFSNR